MKTIAEIVGHDGPLTQADWPALAEEWHLNCGYSLQALAPAGVTCKTCWDTKRCPECLGAFPDMCAADCPDGHCPDCASKLDHINHDRTTHLRRLQSDVQLKSQNDRIAALEREIASLKTQFANLQRQYTTMQGD